MEHNKQDESPDQESSEETIKMNKSSSSEDEKNPNPEKVAVQDIPAPQLRVCDFCGKTFASGKALGGHRRFHFQALRKAAEEARKVKNRTPIPLNTSSSKCDDMKMNYTLTEDGKPTCCLCNKDFPSMKSLFGHMRSHPERDWRGVFPPIPSGRNSNSSSSNSDSEEHREEDDFHSAVIAPTEQFEVVDLLKDLQSWQKTDRRGRKPIGGVEAAENLVLLSQGHCFSGVFLRELRGTGRLEVPGKTPVSCKKRKNGELPSRKYVRQIKVEEEANGQEQCEKIVKVGSEDAKKMNKKQKKRELKLNCHSSESAVDTSVLIKNLKLSDGYKCGVCGKSFPTFQALGGHKSSHNKEKNINMINVHESRPIDAVDASSSETLAISQPVGSSHQNSRGLADTELSSEETSAGEASLSLSAPPELADDQSMSSEAKLLDFDLNEPYFMEDAQGTK